MKMFAQLVSGESEWGILSREQLIFTDTRLIKTHYLFLLQHSKVQSTKRPKVMFSTTAYCKQFSKVIFKNVLLIDFTLIL